MPFGESSVVEASVKKQFNKAGKIFMSRSQKAQVVAAVKKGQAVTLIETSGSWGKVRYGKKTGWTAKSNLGDAKKRVAVDRLAPSVFFEKVRVHPLFFEAKNYIQMIQSLINIRSIRTINFTSSLINSKHRCLAGLVTLINQV